MLAKNEYVKVLPSESESLDNYITLHCRQCIPMYFALDIRPIITACDIASYWILLNFPQTWKIFSYHIVSVYDSPATWNISILINLSKLPCFKKVPLTISFHQKLALMPLVPLMFMLAIIINTSL